VPGYTELRRLQLLSGNDQHITPASSGLVQITAARKDLVLPSGDTLFTSGSLTKYSHLLQDVQRHQASEADAHLASAD
jgi:NADH-quinone oxidoreductase subunit G